MKKKILMGLGIFFGLAGVLAVTLVIRFFPIIKAFDPSLITYSNVKALYIALTMDDAEKDAKLKEIDNSLSQDIKNYVSAPIREFTEEEKAQIKNGEKTQTEIIAQIITEANAEENKTNNENKTPSVETGDNSNSEQTEKPEEKKEDAKPKKETSDEIVARHIANLYVYHNEFEGRVSALKERARAYMNAYKKAHPDITWRDAKIATINNMMSQATAIENDCYAKVDAEIATLEKELKAINADLSVVSTVRTAAYNEMEVRKSKIVAEGQAELNS